ncbi:SrfA family protein [Reyranella sp.]|uniref:SrfA family protein n=1 Tax=Reyranella sp. TaxID=1929291 RepID=UPI003BACA8DD
MPGEATLIVTTRSGVRPLGVRGEPLHNAAPQLRRVVRRRLGDEAADLLADPQLHENDQGIDWYAGWSGPIRAVTDLPQAEQDAVLAGVERTLAEIRRLGDMLAGHGPKEETGVVGLSLKLAARAPSPAFVFLVGDRPVIVAWGYEKEAASALLPLTLPRVPDARVAEARPLERRPVLEAAQRTPISALPAVIPAAGVPWWRTLAAALPLLLLLLAGAWALRGLLPVPPDVSLATREGPPAPPAPEAPPDTLPALKAAFSAEQSRERVLKVELGLAEAELKRRIVDCKPPEVPKPPQVAVAPPPPAPAPAPPKVTPPKPAPAPAPQPRNPADNRLRLPNAPTNDYSFMQGCWRTDPFRHETLQMQPGISSYCFDASGAGQLEWRRGRTACRTRAQARFEGAVLRLRDADSTCNDGSRWFADQLVCQRGADNVAICSGQSRNAYGAPVRWSVNLHKLN